MNLEPFEKIVMTFPIERPKNGRVIGIKQELDKSVTYIVEPLSVHFGPLHNRQRTIRINSNEIGKSVKIEIHKCYEQNRKNY